MAAQLRAVVFVPIPGPDARPYLIEATAGCERGRYEIVTITWDAVEVQGYLDRQEADVIVVADPEHQADLHRAGVTPRIELASDIPPPPPFWSRARWRR